MPSHDNRGYTDNETDLRADYRIPKIYSERPRNMPQSPSYGAYPPDFQYEQTEMTPHHQKPPKESMSTRPIPITHFDDEQSSPTKDYSLCSYFSCCSTDSSGASITNRRKSKKKKFFKVFITGLLILAYIAFLVAALLIESKVELEDYWCRGDGFLIVLTCIVSFFLIYFQVVKPLFKRVFKVGRDPATSNNGAKSLFKQFIANRCVSGLLYFVAIAAAVGFLVYDSAGETERLYSLCGVVTFLLIGFLISAAPRKIKWGSVIWGLGFQYCFGLVILRWPLGRSFFECFSEKVHAYLLFTDVGSVFVFGNLIEQGIFAFKVLSVILFFSMCIQILYYWGAMQWLVMKIGWTLQITVGTTACESINAAANIFLGQTEAPILVKPYLDRMTLSELHAIMTGGFATIAGAVLAAFISFGVNAAHLMSASVMNAPTALAMSKLIYPETEVSKTNSADIKAEKPKEVNVLHAAMEGISAAIPLISNVGASLLAFIAFMAMIDSVLNWGCLLVNIDDGVCSLSNIFGIIFTPVAFIMGVPWVDCNKVGQLVGNKVFVNEFVAYVKLTEFIKDNALTKRGEIISTFALCGFGNISSIGIQIGGLGAMAPSRKGDMARIAIRAVIAGTFATFMTACIAGAMISSNPTGLPTTNMTLVMSEL